MINTYCYKFLYWFNLSCQHSKKLCTCIVFCYVKFKKKIDTKKKSEKNWFQKVKKKKYASKKPQNEIKIKMKIKDKINKNK